MGRDCNTQHDWAITARSSFSYKGQLHSGCKLDEMKMMNLADCFLCFVSLFGFRGLVVFLSVIFLCMFHNSLNGMEGHKIQIFSFFFLINFLASVNPQLKGPLKGLGFFLPKTIVMWIWIFPHHSHRIVWNLRLLTTVCKVGSITYHFLNWASSLCLALKENQPHLLL